MKKVYCCFLFIAAIIQVKSQTYSGQLIAGGSISFKSQRSQIINQEYTLNLISLSPSAGVFVINNLATGFRLDYSRHRAKSGLINERSVSQTFSYSPFIRYYFLRPSNKVNVFVDGSYNFVQNFETSGSNKYRSPGDGYTFSGGPAIFFSESIALEILFGYKNVKFEPHNGSESTIFSSIGFQLHFGKLKKKLKK